MPERKLPPLEEPCTRCDRDGKVDAGDMGFGRIECPSCKGSKMAPTEAGLQIILLLRRQNMRS
ncbi:hypothetical protein [Sphingomonas faeni]|uniref:hypothetical protein n=1 Tax=Sphingomonas faeni TaxID=185950 RepID=UPI00336515C8